MSRRQAREAAMRAVYQLDVGGGTAEEAIEYNAGEMGLSAKSREFAASLVEGVMARKEAIDETLARYAVDWSVERMARTDRSVLRIALFELLYGKTAPPEVILNEAVELAKQYGTEASGRFVNGLLAQALRDRSSSREMQDDDG